jgi:hypothetical protein
MKTKMIFLALLLMTYMGFGQRVINHPVKLLDTTFNAQRFIFSWDGNVKLLVADSVINDSLGSHPNENYLSAKYSYFRFLIKKERIVLGDTMVRNVTITIPFGNMATVLNTLYSSTALKKAMKASLKNEYKKKLSQE